MFVHFELVVVSMQWLIIVVGVCFCQGVNLDHLLSAGMYISEALKRPTASKVAQARGKAKL